MSIGSIIYSIIQDWSIEVKSSSETSSSSSCGLVTDKAGLFIDLTVSSVLSFFALFAFGIGGASVDIGFLLVRLSLTWVFSLMSSSPSKYVLLTY